MSFPASDYLPHPAGGEVSKQFKLLGLLVVKPWHNLKSCWNVQRKHLQEWRPENCRWNLKWSIWKQSKQIQSASHLCQTLQNTEVKLVLFIFLIKIMSHVHAPIWICGISFKKNRSNTEIRKGWFFPVTVLFYLMFARYLELSLMCFNSCRSCFISYLKALSYWVSSSATCWLQTN